VGFPLSCLKGGKKQISCVFSLEATLTSLISFSKRAAVEEAASDELAPAVLKISVLRAKDLLVSQLRRVAHILPTANTPTGLGWKSSATGNGM
jgi:hypothetical protein